MAKRSDASTNPTAVRNLHAPWRLSYMDMLAAAETAPAVGAAPTQPSSSFLREAWVHPEADADHHVIVRTGTEKMRDSEGSPRGGLIMLNKYPYANGHLLVCLGDPRMRLLEYTQIQRAELWSLVDLAVDLCERTLAPQGVNVGLNQGGAAGAGVPSHLHVHVVPRWQGDVNFMSVVANIRVIPSALDDMARRYAQVWDQIRPRP